MKIKTTAFRNNYPAAIMILIILISSFTGSAQTLDGKFYQPIVPPYSWQSGWFKTNLNIPKSAATIGRDTGAIYYKLSDSSLYTWTGSQWRVVSGSGGGSNFANTNLTLTGNRSHDAAGYSLRISNADYITLSSASNNQIDIDESDPNSITLNALSNSSSKLHLVANNNIDYTAGGAHVFVDYVSALITARFHKDSITFPQIKNSVGLDSVLMVTASGKLKQIAKSSLGGGVAYTLINGATNLGSGSQVFKDTSSNKINLRSIVAGSGITVTQNTNDITIAATGGSGTTSRTDSIGYLPESSYSEKDVNEQGYIFQQISNPALSKWYDGVSTSVYKDTIIIHGGWETGASVDSVWQSADGGVTWTFRSLLPYAVHAPAVIHSNDGWTYIIGGDYLNTSNDRAKVVKTKDFRTYYIVNTNTPFRNRVLHAGVEFNDTLYVGGGQKYTLNIADSVYTDLWKSGDGGVTWTLVSNTLTHMGKNIVGCFHVFDGRMYIVTGGKYDNTPSNKTWDRAVYSSTDGLNWRNTGNIPYLGMQYPNIAVWDGKLWLSGGFQDIAGNTDSTAFMDKSGTWHTYLPPNKPPANHAGSMIVYKDKLLRLMGNTTNQVWQLSRYKDKYFETTPNYSRIAIDTLYEGYNSGNGVTIFKSEAPSNNLFFKNTSNTGKNFLRWGTTTFEVWPDSVKKYEFNTQGYWYAKKILASNISTTHYFGGYYSTTLETAENYPGIAWTGNTSRFVLGLDGTQVGFRQESSGADGIRMKFDIADGRLVVNNTTVNSHDVAFTTSAAVEFRSKIKGLLIPRMNSTERDAISSPANSLTLFNYTTNQHEWYDSTNAAWKPIGAITATTGTWTPTLTNTTNVAASTAYEFKYTRVVGTEDIYTFSGEVDIDPTTTATLTVLTFTLPVSTLTTFTYTLSGTASDDLGTSCRVAGAASGSTGQIRFTPTDVTNRRFSVTGQFKYIAP